MPNSATKTKIKPSLKVKEPPLYQVIYINDDVTTMSYVIESLGKFFDYDEDSAEDIAEAIHLAGSSVVAVMPYEIAEQKGIEVTADARKNGFPLKIKLEVDN